jgi:outer membrane protein OmpA-like peptidoglycan-associated protein
MNKASFLVLCLTLATLSHTSLAQEEDAEGCKDSPLISRMAGSSLQRCDKKEYDQFDITVASKDGDDQTKHVEGPLDSWAYKTRDGVSEIQVYRNMENAMRTGGFQIVFERSPEYIAARKGNTWLIIDNRGTYYEQTTITEQAMNQEVTADASSLKGELEKTGHVAVYGILFDTAKATLQPASDEPLNQVLQMLQQDDSLKVAIEGHTDNVGAASANQTLSEKRAQAVRDWLIAKGIAANRLTAKGYGASKPVADNNTDEGRAKNRRVELVKQ